MSLHPEPPNCPKIKLALWLQDSAPEVLKVVSEQPPDFEGLIPPRLENHYWRNCSCPRSCNSTSEDGLSCFDQSSERMLKEVSKSRRRVCVGQLKLVFRSIITHDCRVLKVEEGNSESWNPRQSFNHYKQSLPCKTKYKMSPSSVRSEGGS